MSLIAEVKERENIAEYILYMWQMEDLIRGSNLDLEAIMDAVFASRRPDAAMTDRYRKWFSSMIGEMRENGLEKSGHVKKVTDYMKSLDELHLALLIAFQDKRYIEKYNFASRDILALRQRSKDPEMTDVAVCLTGLYGYLVLKMRKAEISEETSRAMRHMGQLMAYLSKAFRQLQSGRLKLPHQLNN